MLAVLAELAAFTAFTAALGTWISLRSRQTMQALPRVMASLLVLGAGSPLLMTLVLGQRPMALVACGPVLLAASLASPADIHGAPVAGSFSPGPSLALETLWAAHGPEMALTCLASVVGATLGAWLLTRHACRGFDACVDRPVINGPEAGPVATQPALEAGELVSPHPAPDAGPGVNAHGWRTHDTSRPRSNIGLPEDRTILKARKKNDPTAYL
jgi:hypothetical protein